MPSYAECDFDSIMSHEEGAEVPFIINMAKWDWITVNSATADNHSSSH